MVSYVCGSLNAIASVTNFLHKLAFIREVRTQLLHTFNNHVAVEIERACQNWWTAL